jgi:hypothetical protein
MSNEITINVAGPVRSLFTTFQTPGHSLDTRLHDNKAEQHNSKHVTLNFQFHRPLPFFYYYYKTCFNSNRESILFVFNVTDLYKLQTSLAK